jgi:tetratricopeptide (TPR) repeat protein
VFKVFKQKAMKKIQILFFLILIIAASCKSPEMLVNYRENAEKAGAAGDYVIATEAWKGYFNQLPADAAVEGSVYARAAHSAYRANDLQQTIEWFDMAQARDYDSPEVHYTLAEIFRHQENISKELSALEYYTENFDNINQEAYSRLFSIYYQINRREDAVEAWREMPDVDKRSEQNLERFFTLNKQLDNESAADSTSLELLKVNPEHVDALEWQAQKNYEKAEARYQREMKKYESRPTQGSYQTLLRQLKLSTADFRKSLQYFEKLWEANPDNRSDYAVYMNNIHVRFNDKQKADYYRRFIE